MHEAAANIDPLEMASKGRDLMQKAEGYMGDKDDKQD